MRTVTSSSGIQKKGYTNKGRMVEPCKLVHNPWESTQGGVEDTTTHQTSCESRGNHMSSWPLPRADFENIVLKIPLGSCCQCS